MLLPGLQVHSPPWARQGSSWGAQSRLPVGGLLKGAWHLAPHSASQLAQQVDSSRSFHRWVTGVPRDLSWLSWDLDHVHDLPQGRGPPYLLLGSLPVSSASALQTPGGLGLCGSESPLPGAWAEAPSSPQPRGPPRPSSSVRIILAVGQAQPQQGTPQTAGEGDVVFKLSLRRKRKHRDNKERKWPGPAHPVSLVRPPPVPPPHRPPQRQPTTQAGSCASRGLRSGTVEVWDAQGGGPTKRPHRS